MPPNLARSASNDNCSLELAPSRSTTPSALSSSPPTLALDLSEIGLGVVALAILATIWLWWRTRRLLDDFDHGLRENGFPAVLPPPNGLPQPFYSARTGQIAPGVTVTLVLGTTTPNSRTDEAAELRESRTGIGVIFPPTPRFSEAWLGRWEKLSLAHHTAFTTGGSEAPDSVYRLATGSPFLFFDVPHTGKALAVVLGSIRSNLPPA